MESSAETALPSAMLFPAGSKTSSSASAKMKSFLRGREFRRRHSHIATGDAIVPGATRRERLQAGILEIGHEG